tara:strand:+ start:67 stop:222 length:156 start_codon:yes stop_codon:yes gene_type:complete
MIKKISLIILTLSMVGCGTIKDKSSGISKITDTCPPKSERTIKNILCKEAK